MKTRKEREFSFSLLSRIVAAVVLFFFSGTIFGQSIDSFLDNENGTFERYLRRADISKERAEWQRMAAFGVEAVTAEWERSLGGEVSSEDRSEAVGKAEAVVDERYRKWLVNRFFNSLPERQDEALVESIKVANDEYLFVLTMTEA